MPGDGVGTSLGTAQQPNEETRSRSSERGFRSGREGALLFLLLHLDLELEGVAGAAVDVTVVLQGGGVGTAEPPAEGACYVLMRLLPRLLMRWRAAETRGVSFLPSASTYIHTFY